MSAPKRLRDTSPPDPRSSATDGLERAAKYARIDQGSSTWLSSAVDLRRAISRIHHSKPLGNFPGLVKRYRKQEELDDESEDDEQSEDDKKDGVKSEAVVKKLIGVYEEFPVPFAFGTFESSFNLRITRPGCEYDGPVEPSYQSTTTNLIPQWFDHSAVSGYGDNRTLETKVDHEVRSAREILPSEFSVEPQLLELIQTTWAKRFIPAHVRAEPYKIHLYGPGGHFKSHLDTPEKGLVGTFLVGLGDTSRYGRGNFRICNKSLNADPGSWVAFHSDVPHSVSKLKDTHRAVIAFKIFHENTNDEIKLPPELGQRLRECLDQMQPSYGILLDHKYCMGTTEMSGFDALLLAVARSKVGVDVHIIPVVTKFHGHHYPWEDGAESEIESKVYPLTEAHVDILLKRNVDAAKDSIKWLKGVHDIPFYSPCETSTMFTWRREESSGAEYTGNQSDPSREDSIYLSYAMLVLSTSRNVPKDALDDDADASDDSNSLSDCDSSDD